MARNARMFVIAVLVTAICIPSAASMFCGEHNCFELLGLKRNASKTEIRRAYRQISVEKHPDKNPDAAEEYRFITAAYETLTNDEKRAQYEDFLDHPEKYWEYYMMHAKEQYAPKSNVMVVIMGILGVVTGLHWVNMNYNYKSTQEKMKSSNEYRRQVTQLIKSKIAKDEEEAQAMINLDIVGLDPPNWRNLVIFRVALFPIRLTKFLIWTLNWYIKYYLLRRTYSDSDKEYLIRKNMGLDEAAWSRIGEGEKEEFMERELWDKLKHAEYERERRFALKKAGKWKKKRRHVPQSHAEEEVVSEN